MQIIADVLASTKNVTPACKMELQSPLVEYLTVSLGSAHVEKPILKHSFICPSFKALNHYI